MRHGDDRPKAERGDYCLQVVLQACGRVAVVDRFVGAAVAQEVEGNDPASRGGEERGESIVDAKVIREAVHEDERRRGPGIVARVERMCPR